MRRRPDERLGPSFDGTGPGSKEVVLGFFRMGRGRPPSCSELCCPPPRTAAACGVGVEYSLKEGAWLER